LPGRSDVPLVPGVVFPAGAKSPISIRLVPEQIASAKSVDYQMQLCLWIAEGIQRELKRRQSAKKRGP
jgi:hypothetical protein